MARTRQGQGETLSGSPSGQFTNFAQKPIQSLRAPTTADTGYEIGQLWSNTSTGIIYGLGAVSGGSATWNLMSPGASDVDPFVLCDVSQLPGRTRTGVCIQPRGPQPLRRKP